MVNNLTGSVDRIPPHNLEAEMALIGAVLVDREIMEEIGPMIVASDFYAHVHESMWQVIRELYDRGKPLDKITVAEELRNRDLLERVGGMSYISALMDTVQTVASAKYYATIIREKSTLRVLIAIGKNLEDAAYQGEEVGPKPIASKVISLIESTIVREQRNHGMTGGEARDLIANLLTREDRELFRTPWKNVNEQTHGGFAPAEMTIIGGNPGQGKTTWALNLAHYLALVYGKEKGAAAYFPLEMGRDETYLKLVSSLTAIRYRRLQVPKWLQSWEKEMCAEAIMQIEDLPLVVYDKQRPALDIPTLRLFLRKQKRKVGLSSIFIDHVAFFNEVMMNENKHFAQTRMMEECLDIADEFDVPLFLLMHVSRMQRNKEGAFPKPTMYDLRNGGNAEGNAHSIFMIHRPNPKGLDHEKREGYVLIEKARAGGEGQVPLDFLGDESCWVEGGVDSPYWFQRIRRPEMSQGELRDAYSVLDDGGDDEVPFPEE